MDLPEQVVASNGATEDRLTALAMLCARLVWPNRLDDLQRLYGWERTRLSCIVYSTAVFIFERWKHVLHFDPDRLRPTTLRRFADKIHEKGAPLSDCWGFVDGTLRKVSCPIFNQHVIYNGWK